MRGIRWEPVDVWQRHGKPARFIWRGRLYTVLFVLDRRAAPRPGAGPASETSQNSDATGSAAAELIIWRVDAAPGKNLPSATYELCHDQEADRWLLSRVRG